jgi:hypothetical protein
MTPPSDAAASVAMKMVVAANPILAIFGFELTNAP